MNLQPIEDAIRDWVKATTGFPDGQVYFANQDGPQPAQRPYINILVADVGYVGLLDELTRKYDAGMDKVTQTVTGMRDVLVSINCYAENTVSYPVPELAFSLPATQGVTAVEILTRLQLSLALDGVRSGFLDIAVAPYDVGQVRRVDEKVETGWEGRAHLDLRFYASDQQTEQVDRIIEVTGAGTATLEDGTTKRAIPYQVGPV